MSDNSNPFADTHEHDDFCGPNGEFCYSGGGSSKGTDNSSHVKDTASHPNRRVRARVADMIGGGTAYSGPKEDKEPKKPLRDRIADKIATKPKAEDSGSSSAPASQNLHYHGFDCEDPKTCTEKGVGDEF